MKDNEDMQEEPMHPMKVVSLRTGLSPHVIRIWERRYKAVVPDRSSTNRRLYSEDDIERLSLLRRATNAGYAIGQIAGLALSPGARLCGALLGAGGQLAGQIETIAEKAEER